jgi:hypothetical protein
VELVCGDADLGAQAIFKAVGEAGAAPVPLSKTLETFDAYLENKVFSTLSLHCTFIKDFVLFFCC